VARSRIVQTWHWAICCWLAGQQFYQLRSSQPLYSSLVCAGAEVLQSLHRTHMLMMSDVRDLSLSQQQRKNYRNISSHKRSPNQQDTPVWLEKRHQYQIMNKNMIRLRFSRSAASRAIYTLPWWQVPYLVKFERPLITGKLG